MFDDDVSTLAVPVGDDDHVRGPRDAAITLLEYGDFECPYCAMAAPVVKAIEERYRGVLRFAYRNFPLPIHRHAEDAAESSEFAAEHGAFWEMHDTLFQHREALDPRHLLGYAMRLGLSGDALAAALNRRLYLPVVQQQVASGEASGVEGTPTFFVNGRSFPADPTFENLSAAIDALLPG